MHSKEETEELMGFSRETGADLVGIAPMERFEGIPAAHHPASIFPEARSVIVLGKRVTRGCLRGIEEGSQFSLYATYANNWVPNRTLALVTVRVASWLEDRRHEAVPLPDLPPETPPMGVAVRDGAPPPNVMIDFKDAAVRAGLGEIGYTGMLMTPEFGHLQRLQAILTDAELAPTPLFEGEVCDRCGMCASSCPLGAFVDGEEDVVKILGKGMRVAKIASKICASCRNGMFPNPSHPAGMPDRSAASCMRACVGRLDAEGRLKRPFHNRFRRRPAWAVDRAGDSVLVGEEGNR